MTAPSPQHEQLDFLAAFRKAAEQSGTDKVDLHRYDQAYGRTLTPCRDLDTFAMLEIGYGQGAGVSFWRQLFPQAFVYCIDRDLVDRWEPNTGLLRADQSNPDHLQRVIETVRHPISLIIDDGSHHPRHQSLSFSLLFKQLLQPGGLYIIEDIETSYWRRGSIYDYNYNFGLGDQQSAIGAFKTLADHVNRRFLDPADRNLLLCRLLDAGIDPEAADEVEMVSFGRNVVSVSRCLEPNAASTLPGYAYLNLTSRS